MIFNVTIKSLTLAGILKNVKYINYKMMLQKQLFY